MAIPIDFNKPKMLEAYKEQALSQYGLKDSSNRIMVGSQGGLAYTLFQDVMATFPLEISVRTGSDVMTARDYFDGVHTYVVGAEKHAKKHGFGLVRVEEKNLLAEGVRLEDFIYSAGIGSVTIDSAERFQAFLEMIKAGKGELDKQYNVLTGRAQSLTRSRR